MYLCSNSKYTFGTERFESVEEFLEACAHCFPGEPVTLTKFGADYIDESGAIALRYCPSGAEYLDLFADKAGALDAETAVISAISFPAARGEGFGTDWDGWYRFMIEQVSGFGTLCDYETGSELRPATEDEARMSTENARKDGGAGVFRQLRGRRVYVAAP